MKKLVTCVALISGLLGFGNARAGSSLWQQVPVEMAPSQQVQVFHPSSYQVYTFNEDLLKMQMFSLSTDPAQAMIVELPMPDGSYRNFRVWQAPMMPDDLAARYPEIKTFTAVAADNARVTGKLDFTVFGFHAMILDGENTFMIDPYDHFHDGYYMVHYKRDEVRTIENRMKCQVAGHDELSPEGESMDIMQTTLPKLEAKTVNGWNKRTYRLALSADHQYCQAATGLSSPTIAQALSCMTTSMNRINGVYNREFSVQMNFCSKEDTLIWPTATGSVNGADPFSAIDANGTACLSANQTQCTNRVGAANYDVGHVFTTGGGGISSLGVVCQNSSKAQSCTGSPTPVGDGYDIDYVAHEMGHEFGSEHTFNNNMDGSCSGNAVSSCAYEPGSGGTIMDYGGICNPDDLQPHSDPYFSASSAQQIITKLAGSENACAVITTTSNKSVSLAAFTATYTIPYHTPFELTGPVAVDSVADTANTYGWLQWNLGDFGKRLNQTYLKGPIFRSYNPVYNPTRIFPKLNMVLSGTLSNAGTENAEGEKAADTARFLTFKMAVRDVINGYGCFLLPDDTIHLNVVANSTFGGFKVTSQGTTGISYTGGSTQTITWNVVGTDVAPVSAATVDIYMSTDSAATWTLIGNFPNNGSASVTVPNPPATSAKCRFKVKGSGNVFFNINKNNFTVTYNSSLPTAVTTVAAAASDIKVYPVPANDVLHITTGTKAVMNAVIYNAMGQSVWQGSVNGQLDIPVSSWAKGIYHIRFINTENGEQVVKSIVTE